MVGVNHLEGHLASAWLDRRTATVAVAAISRIGFQWAFQATC